MSILISVRRHADVRKERTKKVEQYREKWVTGREGTVGITMVFGNLFFNFVFCFSENGGQVEDTVVKWE